MDNPEKLFLKIVIMWYFVLGFVVGFIACYVLYTPPTNGGHSL